MRAGMVAVQGEAPFEWIDGNMNDYGVPGEHGEPYTYRFGEEATELARALGWRFATRVRHNHEMRADLPEDVRMTVPRVELPAERKTLKDLRTKLLGGIYEIDVTVSTGTAGTEPRVSHWRNEKTGRDMLMVEKKELQRSGASIIEVADDSREVIFIEAAQGTGRHDTIVIRGTLYGHNAMEHRMGESFRMLAQYTIRHNGKSKSWPCLEMLSIRPLDMRPPLTPELAARMAPGDTPEERLEHIARLAHSIAPATGKSHLWPKVSCLLSCVNGVDLADERHNIHTLLIGPPASGKTSVARPLADHVVMGGRFLDATRTTAPGLTYAETTIGQTLALTPGAFVTAPLIVLDEFDALKYMDDIKMLIESQVVAYEKRLKGYRKTDCSLICTANPEDDVWSPQLSIADNIPKIEWAMLSRFNLFLMPPEDDSREGNRTLYRTMRGQAAETGAAYTRDELSAYVAHARELSPEITDECETVLLDYLEGDSAGAMTQEVSDIYGKRLNAALMRNASAFAKLLLKPTVDAECAMLAVRLITESLASFGAKSKVAFQRKSSKSETVIGVLRSLNEMHPNGWRIEMAAAQLGHYTRYFRSENEAREYVLTKMKHVVLQVKEGHYRWTEEML